MKNVLFLCCGLLWATTGHAQSVKELAQDVRDSVVLLEILDAAGDEVSGGTGFAIASNIVATNFHVIDGADRIRVAFGHAEPVEAIALLSTDEKNDLALLLLPDQAALAPLSFASGSPEPGDRVVVVGNPLGLTGSISEGIISAVRSEGLGPDSVDFSETPLLQITAPISPGSSGSPVFSSTGEVVGVAVAYYHGAQNLNFAIPVRLVAQLQIGHVFRGNSGGISAHEGSRTSQRAASAAAEPSPNQVAAASTKGLGLTQGTSRLSPNPSLQRTPQWRVQPSRVWVDRPLVVSRCLLRRR